MERFVGLLTLACFCLAGQGMPLVHAQEFRLPAPGVRVELSPEYNPAILKGIKVHPENPFRFDFILDKGDSSVIPAKAGIQRLIKYFLASLTIPEKDLWVNLSPYEKERIIPQSLGLTEMGRDLLAEDYVLKQITASLIYPEGKTGKVFWGRVYAQAEKKFGTTDVPVNTFNKVWIVPDQADVYENAKAGTAYVVKAKLKVMLETDYLSLAKHPGQPGGRGNHRLPNDSISALGSQILREIVIPELTKEVNEGKNFAQLHQVYNSLILATWYKKKIKDSILAAVYENKNKVVGLTNVIPASSHVIPDSHSVIPAQAEIQSITVESIYQRYLQAFKKGAYNYIKEEVDPLTQKTIPRKYFSGGMDLTDSAESAVALRKFNPDTVELYHPLRVQVDLAMAHQGRLPQTIGLSPRKSGRDLAMLGRKSRQTLLQQPAGWKERKADWDKIYEVWYRKLVQAENRGMVPTFFIGGQSGAGKSTIVKGFSEFLKDRGKNSVIIEPNTSLKNINLRYALRIRAGFSLLFVRDKIAFVNNFLAATEQSRILKQILSDAGALRTMTLNLPGHYEIQVAPGTVIIFEGSLTKNLLPLFIPTSGVYLDLDRAGQKTRIAERAHKKRHSFIRVFVESAIKRSSLLRNVIESHAGGYEYWISVDESGKILRTEPPIVEDGAMLGIHNLQAILESQKVDLERDLAKRLRNAGIEQNYEPSLTFDAKENKLSMEVNFGIAKVELSLLPNGYVPLIKMDTVLFPEGHFNGDSEKKTRDFRRSYGQRLLAVFILTADDMLEKVFKNSRGIAGFKFMGVTTSSEEFLSKFVGNVKRDDVLNLWPDIMKEKNVEVNGLWSREISVDVTKLNRERIEAIAENRPNSAMEAPQRKGGIDLTASNLPLQTNGNGSIRFHIDPAMLQRLQDAPGFVPVIIQVEPLGDLRRFLGMASLSGS